MGEDLSGLKSELRSVVVSSPTQVDVRSLNTDYRRLMGRDIPYFKYGYRDLVVFLKERCSDCFVFMGPPSNPSLTLIVPDSLKHIDKFVQKQKSTSGNKFKGKRRSIPEAAVKPTPPSPSRLQSKPRPLEDLVFSTFRSKSTVIESPMKTVARAVEDKQQNKENYHIGNVENGEPESKNAVKNFLKKRMPLYCSKLSLEEESCADKDGMSSKEDSLGKQPSSSSSGTKRQLELLKTEIMQIISAAPAGVWCTELISLYRERYGRELNFTRLGYTSLISLVMALEARVQVTRPEDTGDWMLADAALAARAPPALPAHRAAPCRPRAAPCRPRAAPCRPRAEPRDPDDALPGVDFDPDVFPADCLDFMESIPATSLDDFQPGASIKVIVGEVYSPSHFWLIRYGESHSIAMEDLMDEMTHYYTVGEGKDRWLARGAVRAGHYCSSVFENDWHRSIIVKIVDSETVKVRHIDYGTVETVASAALKPLRRQFAALAAQALRARLAGARPAGAGRRWPRAAAAHFLHLVREKRLFANVVATDREEAIAEVLLIDTSGAVDASVTELLVRSGHADERRAAATGEIYLYPRFEALESGEAPSYAEINAYLRDGITLDYVEAYRRHVPVDLSPPASPSPLPASSDPPSDSPSPSPDSPSPPPDSPSPTPDSPSPPPASTPSPSPSMGFARIPLLLPQAAGTSAPALAAIPPHEARSASLPAEAYPRPPPPSHPQCVRQPRPASRCYTAPPPRAGYQVWTPRPLPPPLPFPLLPPLPLPLLPPPPPPPAFGAASGAVTLSMAEVEVHRMLSGVDPAAAQWYISCALVRALQRRSAPLNAAAPEFHMPASMRPPPGF